MDNNNQDVAAQRAKLQAEIERLQAENAKLREMEQSTFRIAVSENTGCVSVYGLGRFPVSLYEDQWADLLGHASDILAFIRDNETAIKVAKERAELKKLLAKKAKK